MGQYLIPNAKSTIEVIVFVGTADGRLCMETPEGIVLTDPNLTDAQVQALLDGFTPSGQTDDEFVIPIPARWRTHLAHLRDYRNGIRNGTLSPTTAQRDHVIADLIDLCALVLPRLDTDG